MISLDIQNDLLRVYKYIIDRFNIIFLFNQNR